MADRVYPAGKPTVAADQNPTATATPAAFPATKAQLYNASRPAYRPHAPTRRRRRCCRCCLWTTVTLAVLLLLAAVAAAVLFLVYQPRKPTFGISNLQLDKFNLTKSSHLSSHLSSRLSVSVIAKNPNKKIGFLYSRTEVSAFSKDVPLGSGSFPAFTHASGNATVIKSDVVAENEVENESAASLRDEVKKNKGFLRNLKVVMDSKVRVEIGKTKTRGVHIRVVCDGISVAVPSGKEATNAVVGKRGKCKVDLRIKIWKWTF